MQYVSNGCKRVTGPQPHELEISLFGPGFGECVVLHLGYGKWLIIDSCLNVKTGSPCALEYLRRINVDPATSVFQIIATHWHDDHVRGLGEIFRTCRNAEFVCSDALREKEFLTLVAAYSKSRTAIGSGVDELAQVIDEMQKTSGDLRRFKFALADQCLWRGHGRLKPCSVYALSPSSYSCVIGQVALAKLLPDTGPMRRVPVLMPNHAAIALWICVGMTIVLLGSDLEETGHPSAGWSAILSSQTRPEGKACIYKVAHHGSVNGDTPNVWSSLLDHNPIAALTPYMNGNTILPQVSDIGRICSHTTEAYTTALPKTRHSPRRPSAVEKTIREVAQNFHPVFSTTGQVRIRVDLIGNVGKPQIDLFNGALKLQNPVTP